MVGGFVVTDRMLQMFVRKKKKPRLGRAPPVDGGSRLMPTWVQLVYLLCARLLHPRAQGPVRPEDRPQRQPDRRRRRPWWPVRCRSSTSTIDHVAADPGSRSRSAPPVACIGAQQVQMTQMPQMVALFNGVGGGAAALVALLELHEHIELGATRRPFDLVATAFTIARRLGLLRRLDRHLRQAPGADDVPAGDLPRPAGRCSAAPCSPRVVLSGRPGHRPVDVGRRRARPARAR